MRLYALSTGIEVPVGSFSGTIHSVFRSACNLRLEDEVLITLLSSEDCNAPWGIRLNSPPPFAFLRDVQIGQPVACRGGILRFGASDLSVSLQTAKRWHVDLKELGMGLGPDITRGWQAVWSVLKRHRRRDGLSAMVDAPASGARILRNSPTMGPLGTLVRLKTRIIPDLLVATRDVQVSRVVIAIKPMIGLGPGLTPSGDDFIVGYLAGLWSTLGDDPTRLQFISSLERSLTEALTDTNPISRGHIKSAFHGHFSEPVSAVAQHVVRAGRLDGIQAVTRAALRVGHTSGADGLLGLLLGLMVWTPSSSRLVDADFPWCLPFGGRHRHDHILDRSPSTARPLKH